MRSLSIIDLIVAIYLPQSVLWIVTLDDGHVDQNMKKLEKNLGLIDSSIYLFKKVAVKTKSRYILLLCVKAKISKLYVR